MKKKKKRLLIVCVVLLILLLGVVIWQKNNLQAGLLYAQYSTEDLEEKMEENEKEVMKALDKVPEAVVQPLSEEERQKLRDGTITEDEAMALMTGAEPKNSESQVQTASESNQVTTQVTNQETKQQTDNSAAYIRIQELIARVYVMRDVYVSKLEGIRESAVNAYYDLPKDKRTDSAKMEIAFRCIDQANALESTCDGEMDDILAELKTQLQEVNGDLSLVSDVKAAYAEEKALKKAYYMNLYQQ